MPSGNCPHGRNRQRLVRPMARVWAVPADSFRRAILQAVQVILSQAWAWSACQRLRESRQSRPVCRCSPAAQPGFQAPPAACLIATIDPRPDCVNQPAQKFRRAPLPLLFRQSSRRPPPCHQHRAQRPAPGIRHIPAHQNAAHRAATGQGPGGIANAP